MLISHSVPARLILAFVLLSLCAGCSGTRYAGRGASSAQDEASAYRARAQSSYPMPGPADDPWAPYIQEAAGRFQVQERWVREVMRRESGGRLYDSDGTLTTSGAGAMGLMQVMPRTFAMLRDRYGLADDPYEPRTNILAGTAYIREMYDRYGSPGFLAAYNGGPGRMDAYLAGSAPLPTETADYLAAVGPRLDGRGTSYADGAYAGGGMTGLEYQASLQQPAPGDDPSMRAFDGGGLVTPQAPTGVLTRDATVVAALIPAAAAATLTGGAAYRARRENTSAGASGDWSSSNWDNGDSDNGEWGIQVGAYPDPANSQAAIDTARSRAGDLLARARPAVIPVQRAGTLYRARLIGLSADGAAVACERLARSGMDCFAVRPGS